MIGIGTDRERTIHAGALVQIDARNQSRPDLPRPERRRRRATPASTRSTRSSRCSPRTSRTGSDPVARRSLPRALARFRTAASSPRGPTARSTTSTSSSATPPDFGIYIYDPVTQTNQLVYNDGTTWDLNALAVVPRTEPPAIGSHRRRRSPTRDAGPPRLGQHHATRASTRRCSGAQFASTIPLASALQRRSPSASSRASRARPRRASSMFGLTMDEGAAVLGTAPVYADGSWLANVPAVHPDPRPADRQVRHRRSATSASGSRARPARTAAASAATSRAPARASRPSARTRPRAEQATIAEPSPSRSRTAPSTVGRRTRRGEERPAAPHGEVRELPQRLDDDVLRRRDDRPGHRQGDVYNIPTSTSPTRPSPSTTTRGSSLPRLVRLDLLPGLPRDGRHDGHHGRVGQGPADLGHPGGRAQLGPHPEAQRVRVGRHGRVARRHQFHPEDQGASSRSPQTNARC